MIPGATTAQRRSDPSLLPFRTLIEHSGDAVTVIAPDGTVRYRNPTGTDLVGYTNAEMIGRCIFDFVHPDDLAAVSACRSKILAAENERMVGRTRFRHKDGSWRLIGWSARNAIHLADVEGFILNSRDETEVGRAQEQRRQADKIEAMEQFAGGFAHRFNNLLGAIMGFIGLLLDDLPRGTSQRKFAARVQGVAEEARDLIAEMLVFRNVARLDLKPIDLVQLTTQAVAELAHSLPLSTSLEVAAPSEPLIVSAHCDQLRQLLANLCLNASEAFEDKPGPIHVTLAQIPGSDAPQFDTGSVADGQVMVGAIDRGRCYAVIRVSDRGCGVGNAKLKRIFDPFYTTKAAHRRNGFGLTTVQTVVAACAGACIVRSAPGFGTEVTVYLPLCEQSE